MSVKMKKFVKKRLFLKGPTLRFYRQGPCLLKVTTFYTISVLGLKYLQKSSILGAQMSPKLGKNPSKNRSKNLLNSYDDFYLILAQFWTPFGSLGPPFGSLGPPFWVQKSSWGPPWSSFGRQMFQIRPQTLFLKSF